MSWGKTKSDPADLAFSRWIRLRDKKCLRCGSIVKLNSNGMPVSHEASHFMGRSKENTRFMPENVCTLCAGCHAYFTSHPLEHYEWQVERLGQETVDIIKLASSFYCKKDRKSQLMYWRKELNRSSWK